MEGMNYVSLWQNESLYLPVKFRDVLPKWHWCQKLDVQEIKHELLKKKIILVNQYYYHKQMRPIRRFLTVCHFKDVLTHFYNFCKKCPEQSYYACSTQSKSSEAVEVYSLLLCILFSSYSFSTKHSHIRNAKEGQQVATDGWIIYSL